MTEDNHLMFRTEGIFFSKASFQEGPTSHPFSASSFSGVRSSVIELSSFSKNAVSWRRPSFFWWRPKIGWFPTECTFFYGFRIVILHPLQTQLRPLQQCFHQPNPTSSSWKGLLVPAASSTTSFLRCHLTPAQLGSQCATFVEIPFPALLWLQLLLNHQWLYPCRSTSISIYFQPLIYIYI